MVQVVTAIFGTAVVLGLFALRAAEPGQFFEAQLQGFADAAQSQSEAAQNPFPEEFGYSLAWGLLMAQLVAAGFVALVLPRRIGPSWKRQLGVRWPAGKHIVLVLLIAPAFMVAADGIHTAFLRLTGLQPQSLSRILQSLFGSFPWPLTMVAVAVGPGVVEEFWCRGFIGRGLCARYGVPVGVALTSVFFALMHADLTQLLIFTLMGAYLHGVYLATRSIWPPVLLHAGNNGLGVLLELNVPAATLAAFPPLMGYCCAFAVLGLGSWLLWQSRVRLGPVTSWQPEYPGISTPPPKMGITVASSKFHRIALGGLGIAWAGLLYFFVMLAR
ncbi:MAG: type II CAAX endopeptidase family protein [Gemmataceae bacterium]|nr:CPBP family intramembrane metalloprotease [Gemmata sp.]MDW8196995.1 type II CAAX endopeptidase family protein [Gemmataceae bacterium]